MTTICLMLTVGEGGDPSDSFLVVVVFFVVIVSCLEVHALGEVGELNKTTFLSDDIVGVRTSDLDVVVFLVVDVTDSLLSLVLFDDDDIELNDSLLSSSAFSFVGVLKFDEFGVERTEFDGSE